MIRTTREIENKMDETLFWLIAFLSLIFIGTIVFMKWDFQHQIDSLPHKICHNETTDITPELSNYTNFQRVYLETSLYFNQKVIKSCNGFGLCGYYKIKEVCEIK